jgi:hypothetical protein
MDDGWGPHGPPSTWREQSFQPQSFHPQRTYNPRRTAEDFFKQWEQEDRDKGLRVYMDYKLDLGALLGSLEHLDDGDVKLGDVLATDPKRLSAFRMIKHLTLAQVRRVHYLMDA